jgi:hypothetical protein
LFSLLQIQVIRFSILCRRSITVSRKMIYDDP